jgi:hypothetical protein
MALDSMRVAMSRRESVAHRLDDSSTPHGSPGRNRRCAQLARKEERVAGKCTTGRNGNVSGVSASRRERRTGRLIPRVGRQPPRHELVGDGMGLGRVPVGIALVPCPCRRLHLPGRARVRCASPAPRSKCRVVGCQREERTERRAVLVGAAVRLLDRLGPEAADVCRQRGTAPPSPRCVWIPGWRGHAAGLLQERRCHRRQATPSSWRCARRPCSVSAARVG